MNIIKKYSIAFWSLCLILFTSVSCTDHDKIDAGLVAFPSALTVDYHGLTADEKKEISFTITSNTDWKVNSDVDWITPSHVSGAETRVIFLKVGINETGEDRTGTIVVTAADLTQEIVVSQHKKVDDLTVQPTSLTVYSNGLIDDGKKPTISLATNSKWNAESKVSWIKLDKTTGEQEFPVITLDVEENQGIARTGTIEIVSGSKSATVKVTQIAQRLEVTPEVVIVNRLGVDASGKYPTIEITADKDWFISTTDTWIIPEKTSGNLSNFVVLTTKENTTAGKRTGRITITSGSLTTEVQVIQSNTNAIINDDGRPVGYVYMKEDFNWITSVYVDSKGSAIPDFMSDYEKSSTPTIANVLGVAANDQLKKDWEKAGWTNYVEPGVTVSVYVLVGALKFGTSTRGGGIISPALGIESGKYSNLKVQFDLANNIAVSVKDPSKPNYGTGTADNPFVTVEIRGNGTFTDGTTSQVLPVDNTKWNDWQAKSLVVKDASEDTQLIFRSQNMGNDTGRSRWYLDNVEVVKESEVQ